MKNKLSIILLFSIILSSFAVLVNAAGEETQQQNTETQQQNINENGETQNTETQEEESLENEISKVEISGDNKVKIFLDKYIKFKDGIVNGEFKILKQLKVGSAIKDSQNKKLIKINLDEALEKNSYYNVLDVNTGLSLDFEVKDNLENVEINNDSLINSGKIEKIKIINSKSVEIYTKEELNTEDLNINFFELLKIVSKKGYNDNSGNYVELTLAKNLKKNDNYILTVLDLQTSNGNKINFTDSGYKEFSSIDEQNNVEQELQNLQENDNDIKETEKTALNTEQTPDTGTATNILLLLTFILSTAYFIYSRKRI